MQGAEDVESYGSLVRIQATGTSCGNGRARAYLIQGLPIICATDIKLANFPLVTDQLMLVVEAHNR